MIRGRLVLLAALAACASPGPRSEVAPPRLSPPSTAITRDTADVDPRADVVAASLGLPPLRLASLPAGTREVRFWRSSGPGIPLVMIRVLQTSGDARAEWFAWWPRHRDPRDDEFMRTFHRQMREEWRCGPIRSGDEVDACVLATLSGDRARAMVARLDSLSAWTPPPPPREQYIQIDGRSLDVEARTEDSYRRYRLGNHTLRTDRTAAAVWRAVSSVDE